MFIYTPQSLYISQKTVLNSQISNSSLCTIETYFPFSPPPKEAQLESLETLLHAPDCVTYYNLQRGFHSFYVETKATS